MVDYFKVQAGTTGDGKFGVIPVVDDIGVVCSEDLLAGQCELSDARAAGSGLMPVHSGRMTPIDAVNFSGTGRTRR